VIHWKEFPKLTSIGNYEVCVSLRSLLEDIERYIKEYNLNLLPDFQRGHVWTKLQKVRFVEYLLRGGQTNTTLYFNHPNWMNSFKGDFVIVDGLQRLTAVMEFLNNEFSAFSYRAKDIDLGGHYNLKFNINNLKTRREVLQWYLEINDGGTPHSETEIEKVKKLLKKEK
jgi:uncharacterized protein with ParB-like and HNH nuclease domain